MTLKIGEWYRCPNPDYGCESQVTRSAGPTGGNMAPCCCCGMEMKKVG